MMLQLLGESLHCVGMLQLCSPRLRPASDCPRSFSLCHHCATVTRLSEAGSPCSWTVLSFFLCSSNSYRILTKNRKRRGCEGGYLYYGGAVITSITVRCFKKGYHIELIRTLECFLTLLTSMDSAPELQSATSSVDLT